MSEPIHIVAQAIEMVAVQTLIEYPGNAKRHPDDQIARLCGMIREFGWTVPILIDSNNSIIAGHGRLMAARKLNMEAVPCIRAGHLSRAQIKALVLADNKIAEGGNWDLDTLKAELPQIAELDETLLALTGFSQEELDALLDVDLESFEPDDEGQTETKVEFLTFCGKRIEITDEELQELLAALEQHMDAYGSPQGFVIRTLLPARFLNRKS